MSKNELNALINEINIMADDSCVFSILIEYCNDITDIDDTINKISDFYRNELKEILIKWFKNSDNWTEEELINMRCARCGQKLNEDIISE